jgi:hypothetical protein
MVACYRIGGRFAGGVFHLHQLSLEAGQTSGTRVSVGFQEVKRVRYLIAIQCQLLLPKGERSGCDVRLSVGYNSRDVGELYTQKNGEKTEKAMSPLTN